MTLKNDQRRLDNVGIGNSVKIAKNPHSLSKNPHAAVAGGIGKQIRNQVSYRNG